MYYPEYGYQVRYGKHTYSDQWQEVVLSLEQVAVLLNRDVTSY